MAPRKATAPGSRSYNINMVTFRVVRDASSSREYYLNGPHEVAALAREIIPDDAREHFVALYLSSRNTLIAAHEVSVGTLSASLVHPREVFGPALRIMGVASIILIHNHPSGNTEPSQEDIRLTRQLIEGAKLLDLAIHDHVIIGHGVNRFVSFVDRRLL